MILTIPMAHPRKAFRQAVVAQLVAANTAAGTRVTVDQVDPHKKGALPAISLFVLSESVADEAEKTYPRELERHAAVEIVGWVSGKTETEVADAMDDIAEQIEAAMDGDRYINSKAGDSILVGTEMEIREGGSSDPLIGLIALTYLVTYRTSQGATATDDFLTVKATHELVGGVANDTVPAQDTFTVQEISP